MRNGMNFYIRDFEKRIENNMKEVFYELLEKI